MTDDKISQKPAKKRSDTNFLIAAALVLFVLGAALFVTTSVGQKPLPPLAPAQTSTNTPTTPAQPTPPGVPQQAAAPGAPAATIDVASALSERVLGDENAPLRISEHASLTCSHCGEFHKDSFDKVKANYIDTKKAYLVFSDFPLNEPAMKASMVARCLPHDKYFDFIHMLYTRQDDWAFDQNYQIFLKQQAALNGLAGPEFDACISSKPLEDGIIDRMKAVSAQWHINSTPSFVLNNKTTISGAYPYEAFSKILDNEYAKATGKAPIEDSKKMDSIPQDATQEKAPSAPAPAPSTAPAAGEPSKTPSPE